MAGVSGDFSALGELAAKIRQLSGAGFREPMAQRLGAAAIAEVRREFDEGRDPYGVAWKPPVLRQGEPLRDTGRLNNSFVARSTADGFSVASNVRYLAVHQDGATIEPVNAPKLKFRTRGRGGRWYTLDRAVIPRRQIIPTQERGLGSWGDALNREADRGMRDYLGLK
jgi:phage gpG-like protein